MKSGGLLGYGTGAASGFNRGLLGIADAAVGNPLAGLLNFAGADISRNPITRTMGQIGVGRDPVTAEQAAGFGIGNVPGAMLGGSAPIFGDIGGLAQDINAMRAGDIPVTPLTVGLAATGALPLVPSLLRMVPPHMWGNPANTAAHGQAGAVGFIDPSDYRMSAVLDEAGSPVIKPGRVFSQRKPRAANSSAGYIDAPEDHLINFRDWASSPAGKAAAEKLPDNEYLKIDSRYGTEGRLEQALDQMQPRLASFADRASPEVLAQAGNWYPGFNNFAWQLAEQRGIPVENAAAAIAALSPSTPWDANLEHLMRLAHMTRPGAHNLPIDSDVRRFLNDPDWGQRYRKSPAKQAALDRVLRASSVGDVLGSGDPLAMATLTSAMDRAWYPATQGSWNPQGVYLGDMATKAGTLAAYKPNSMGANANALRALFGDYSAASNALGNAHKVRSFATNGANPDFPNVLTMDTHMVGANLGAPLGSGHPLVEQNFGSAHAQGMNPAATGYSGMYPLHHEAGLRVSADLLDRGVIPRFNAGQSIPWEVKRGAFASNPSTTAKAEKIWEDFRKGWLTNDQAIDRIWSELAR